MFIKQYLYTVIIIFFLFTVNIFGEKESCFTYDGLEGTCEDLENCKYYIQLLTNAPKPLPSSLKDLLIEGRCGFKEFQPIVCCPNIDTNMCNEKTNAASTNQGNNEVFEQVLKDNRGKNEVFDKNVNVEEHDKRKNYSAEYPNRPILVLDHPNINLLPKECGQTDDGDRLFGGNKTGIFEFPWMALIAYKSRLGESFSCGGTIINERYILTAAHCVNYLKNKVIQSVRVGEHDLSTQEDCTGPPTHRICAPLPQNILVEKIIYHDNYAGFVKGKAPMLQHDIGLLRLKDPIDMTPDNIMPICLPTTKELQEYQLDDKIVVVTGWGVTETDHHSEELLKINIPVITNEICGGVLNDTVGDGIGFRQVCTRGKIGVDSCNGDSGGPMVLKTEDDDTRFVQHGIVSFGARQCGRSHIPAVFTRVAYYMDWILDHMEP